MKQRIGLLVVLSAVVLAMTALVAARDQAVDRPQVSSMTVHEWGTFTSVAGESGQSIQWTPVAQPTDLPCFVTVQNPKSIKVDLKGWLPTVRASVRMETPVLYFYASTEERARVRVGFPQGVMTEWYPPAVVAAIGPWFDLWTNTGSIEWPEVRIRPSATADLPDERDGSHYYAARETDSAIVQVGGQSEKFLFYRGLANFPVPIAATSRADGSVDLQNAGSHEIGATILFENYGGRVAFRQGGALRDTLTLARPVSGDLASLRKDLQEILIANGLYPREAAAMLETWRDSWFTEGTRLFYVVPPAAVDAILPLDIDPRPAQVARVFVGRIEVITPATQERVIAAIRRNDGPALSLHSRFLEPIVQRILSTRPADLDQASAQLALRTITAWQATAEQTCR
jgi:hypothetical protein